MDAQATGAAAAPVTGLHLIDGVSAPLLYVVTEQQTSVIDLGSNQLVRSLRLCAPASTAAAPPPRWTKLTSAQGSSTVLWITLSTNFGVSRRPEASGAFSLRLYT